MKKGVIAMIIVGIVLILLAVGFFALTNNKNPSNKDNSSLSKTNNISSLLEEQNSDVGNTKTLFHKDFRAVIPVDWQELEIPPAIYVYLPPNTSQEDIKAEVISIVVSPLGENSQSLDELTNIGIETSKKVMPDFELTDNIDITKGKLKGKRLKFTGTQEGVKRNFVQIAGIQYNKLYALTYSCPINECKYHEVFNNLAETIEITEGIKR